MNVDEAMETAAAYLAFEQVGEPLFCAEEVAITLAKEVERLRAELAAAKTAGELPVVIQSVYVNKYLGSVVVFIEDEKGAVAFDAWLTKRQDKSPPEA